MLHTGLRNSSRCSSSCRAARAGSRGNHVFFRCRRGRTVSPDSPSGTSPPCARASLYHLLTQEGFSVLTADNGQQALDLLDRGIRPSLIMVDLMLPRVSGFDLIN